jgi:uncharacterized membrane protein YccC
MGLKRAKEIFFYSDSEPNEVLIAFCHLIALPASILFEYENPQTFLCIGAVLAGAFQMWAVLFSNSLKMRLIAVQVATLIAIMTIENLYVSGLLNGSRVGWVIIGLFAAWNTLRVYKEKLDRGV